MAGLKVIKTKIRSVEKTKTVTKAMEAVSAAKMRKAQTRATAGRAYAKAAVSILARVSGSQELANHPYTAAREVKRALYIVITSDKGLAGALNSAILRKVLSDIQEAGLSETQVSIIAIGRKANDFFTTRGYTVEKYHPHTDEISPALIKGVVDEAALDFVLGAPNSSGAIEGVDVVKIAYQNFISTFEQEPTVRTIFPLSLEELELVVGDIGRLRIPGKAARKEKAPSTYTLEPSEEEVLGTILPLLASIFVYHALLESQASEHSARMVSMKSASDKAEELTHALTLQFNKARQAAITREVSEITGGMEAMSTN